MTPPQATLADWLTLHGVSADQVMPFLGMPDPDLADHAPDPPFSHTDPVSFVANALAEAFPLNRDLFDRLPGAAVIDLAPDPARFPRPFTLLDPNSRKPCISCPMRGRLSDLLYLAHELGHAAQLLEIGADQPPPVMREMAAYVAEYLLINSPVMAMHDLVSPLRMLHQARSVRVARKHGTALREALADPSSHYSYDWNYAVARVAAKRLILEGTTRLQRGVISGKLGLGEVLEQVPHP